MDYALSAFISILLQSVLVTSIANHGVVTYAKKEYCQWETFNASCPSGSVILMDVARYGRMRLGACLTTDFYIGCFVDILEPADALCSGRRSCLIRVPDENLHAMQECPKDMMAYLEAGYSCIPVTESNSCDRARTILPTDNGFLSSSASTTSSFGFDRCRWSIFVTPGQQVNFTLYDFSLWNLTTLKNAIYLVNKCVVYAVITNRDGTNFTVCGGKHRESIVYTSTSNEVTLVLTKHAQLLDIQPNFLLKYQAVGCPDITAPKNARVQRRGDKLMVACNFSTQAWHLVCSGTSWVGDYSNCSSDAAFDSGNLLSNQTPMGTYGLILAIFIGIALGVVVGVMLLCLVLIHKRRCNRRRDLARKQMLMRGLPPGDRAESAENKYGVRVARGGDYGYTHVWEMTNQHQLHECPYNKGIHECPSHCNHQPSTLTRNSHFYISPHPEELSRLSVPSCHDIRPKQQGLTNTNTSQVVNRQGDGESDDSFDDVRRRETTLSTFTPHNRLGYEAVPTE